MRTDADGLLCISLHDVAPATLDECMDTLAFLDDLGLGPVALLVVPDYHGMGRADRDDRFASFIESRILRGDEIVLHGYRHSVAANHPRSIRDWLTQRLFDASAGEFAQLDFRAARTRILRGLVVMRSAGWQPVGFAPPAWRISTHVLSALEESPLRYCSLHDSIAVLRTGRLIPARNLHFSVRSGWRRALSLIWNATLFEPHSAGGIVRIPLHPADLHYPEFESLWRRLPSQIADRTIVTEAQLIPAQSRRAAFAPPQKAQNIA